MKAIALTLGLLVASGTGSRAAGQEWAARFPRGPDCDLKRIRGPGPASGVTGTLIMRPVRFGTDTSIDYARVVLNPVEEPEPPIRPPGPDERAPVRVFDGLAPGRYRLMVLALGYARRTDTVTVDAGAIDTLRLPMLEWNEGFRNRHNCRPRGFRRSGEPACVTDDSTTAHEIEYARYLAAPGQRDTFNLPAGDSLRVELIRDEKTCARAARLYGREDDPPRRVIVIRMDNIYLVYDPFEPLDAGEWNVYKIFDRRWRELILLLS
jgi:hypothetical protein